ncbi:YdcF family protein [Ilumatobacter nonamiensis]|uniref:YdcF family protein n=1 Tax=Ilumatobacter nonamiensis TaxID=467093 RepID=UPI000347F305|nr:YdcF family protein [Ilumatobacter nonamiensis]
MSSTGQPEFERVRSGDTQPNIVVPAGDTTPVAPERPVYDDGRTHPAPRKRSRFGRRVLTGVALVVAALLAYYLVTLAQVWTTGRSDDRDPVDAIVVMGAAQYDGRPSPQLAARLDHVVEIWADDVAPLVVVTGGNIPGDRFTEAEASAAYLTERGIPESALLLENEGSNSYESLDGVASMLGERGLESVVIVTDPYHSLRSELIAEEVGLDASVSSTDTSVVTGGDSALRHLEEAGGVAVGRIIGFDRLSNISD